MIEQSESSRRSPGGVRPGLTRMEALAGLSGRLCSLGGERTRMEPRRNTRCACLAKILEG